MPRWAPLTPPFETGSTSELLSVPRYILKASYAFTGYAALLAAAAPLLAADGEVVVEHSSRLELPLEAGPLVRTDVRRYGESSLSFYRRRPG